MKITELSAYKRLEEMFKQKGYSLGKEDDMPICSWNDVSRVPTTLTPGHFAYAIEYSNLKFSDVPEEYRTRGFFLHTLSDVHKDIIEYVKADHERFDRQFFKDHIATSYYSLQFKFNDFEYMPLDFIDEEMVACAMFRAVNMRYAERRGDCEEWFYSVHRRKPEVLTQELYILGARCFGRKIGEENRFLTITPEEYRTPEFYFALCLENGTPVMEDIPESILTTEFLWDLLIDSTGNIKCFSEAAFEREITLTGRGKMKFWQAVVIRDAYQIRNIPLNDERVEFFLSRHDKDSMEYEHAFKSHYKEYLRKKNPTLEHKNSATELGSKMALVAAMSGAGIDHAIGVGTVVMNSLTNRQSMLPIYCGCKVPKEFSKQYDKEEYLLEIYKTLGIKVLEEADRYFYNAILPDNISVVKCEYGDYWIKDSKGKFLIHYSDTGNVCDRKVKVDQINVIL